MIYLFLSILALIIGEMLYENRLEQQDI